MKFDTTQNDRGAPSAADLHRIGNARSHREAYPEQYSHHRVGQLVRVMHQGREVLRGRNRKVADILGKDYQPIIVQHPGSGKILEVATEQAVAKASNDPKAVKRAAAKAASKKPTGPDVDAMLTIRLAQLMHKNAPKSFGRAWLFDLANEVYAKLNLRDKEAVALAWRWPANAFRHGYGSKLPAQVSKLGERDLVLFMFHLIFATGPYARGGVLKLFGIDEAKTRVLIIAERKKAAADARAARKSGRAKK